MSEPGKTERPTPRRLSKARQKGNVPKSQEMSKVVVLLAGLFALRLTVPGIGREMSGLFTWFLKAAPTFQLDHASLSQIVMLSAKSLTKMLLPLLLIIAVAAYVSMRLQVGKLWKPMTFDLSKSFNLIASLKNTFFNIQTFIRLGRSMLQAAIIAIAPYMVLRSEWDNLLPLFFQNVESIASYLLSTGYKVALYATFPMIAIAVADLLYTRWKYTDNLKMTKEEVKDEHKQSEGDPKIKSQQRQKMMATMQKRMLSSVPKADVIITNPTHFAVALRYDAMESPAPMVVAKGVDFMAQKIKDIAREHNIPIRENKPLARALYKSVEVDEAIPEELYQAVATILAEIYRIKGRRR